MKKVLIIIGIILVLIIGLFACVGGGDDGDKEVKPEQKTEQDQAKEEKSNYPITVEDNDYFTLEILGTEYDSVFGEDVSCKYTNKMDKAVTFSADSVILNDEATVDTSLYFESAASTSNKDSFLIDPDDFDEYKDNPVKVTVKYHIVDSDSYDKITEGEFTFTLE